MESVYSTSSGVVSAGKAKAFYGTAGFVFFLVFVSCVRTFHDFSFVLLLGLYVEFAGLLMVTAHVVMSRSMSGLSQLFVGLYALATTLRFYADYYHEAYLPGDTDEEHAIYRMLSGAYTLTFVGLLVASLTVYKDTISSEVGGLKVNLAAVAGIVIASFILRPYVLRPWYLDVIWTAALYIEAYAVVPQLMMIRKLSVRKFLLHFMFAVAIGKALQCLFWLWYFGFSKSRMFLLIHVGAYGINLVLMSRFIKRYLDEMSSCPLPMFGMK